MAAHLHHDFGAVVMANFGKLSHARDEFIIVNEDTSRFAAFTAAAPSIIKSPVPPLARSA